MFALFENLAVRQLRMLLLGAGMVITALAVTAALLPAAKGYRSASGTAAVLESARASSADLEQQLAERRANIDDLKFRLHGDMANLPLKRVESYVIGRLQEISWRNDVDLVSVEPASGQEVQIFTEMLFNIELVGEYENVYRWLWDIKNELGFIVIKEYAMRRRDNIDDNPRLVTRISLASYRAKI